MSRRRTGDAGSAWPDGPVMRLCRGLLRLAARSVPLLRRESWLEEWEAELWTLHSRGGRRVTLLRFAVDAIGEARWERREDEGAMGGLAQDLRYAWRRLTRNPGFTLVVVLVLALGIGANTVLFGALKAALLDGPPYPEADRLVTIDLLLQQRAAVPADTMPWSWPKFELMRDNQQTMEDLAGWVAQTNTVTGEGPAQRVGVEYVTSGYFDLLGVAARAGRVFGPSEENPSMAVVLSYGFWQSRFGGDRAVLGRTLMVEGVSLEIIGIAPESFSGLSGSADLWVPVSAIPAIRGPRRLQLAWAHWLTGIGRLADGITLGQARLDGERMGGLLTAAFPDPSGGGAHGVTMVPLQAARVNPVTRQAIAAVSVAGLLLLLIACGNVAGLMVTRVTAQRGDTMVRAALGAGRGRLLRESLVESLMLAGAGGALGLLLAFAGRNGIGAAAAAVLDLAGTRGMRFLSPESIGVNAPVLLAGLGLALLTGLVAGIVPARVATRFDLGADLRAGRGAVGRRAARNAGRSILVAAQLAFTVVLLAGAGLMAASFSRLSSIDIGFTNSDVLAVTYDFGPGSTAEAVRTFESEVTERAAALPGVTAVAIAPCPPLAGRCEVVGLRRVDDQPPIDYGDMNVGLLAYAVSDDYFRTLGIPVREGRTPGPEDGPGAPSTSHVPRRQRRTARCSCRRSAIRTHWHRRSERWWPVSIRTCRSSRSGRWQSSRPLQRRAPGPCWVCWPRSQPSACCFPRSASMEWSPGPSPDGHAKWD
jgi:putative ABC transport system permease protein